MKFSWNKALLATGVAVGLVTAGCGGFNAAPSVSPMMFLVPGLGQTKPQPSPAPQPAKPAAEPPAETVLAQAR